MHGPLLKVCQGNKIQRTELLLEAEFAGLRGAGLTAPLLAGLLVVLTRFEKFQDPFAFHFLFETFQGPFKRLVLSDINF